VTVLGSVNDVLDGVRKDLEAQRKRGEAPLLNPNTFTAPHTPNPVMLWVC